MRLTVWQQTRRRLTWRGLYYPAPEAVTRINDVIYRTLKSPKGKTRIVHFHSLSPYHGKQRVRRKPGSLSSTVNRHRFLRIHGQLRIGKYYESIFDVKITSVLPGLVEKSSQSACLPAVSAGFSTTSALGEISSAPSNCYSITYEKRLPAPLKKLSIPKLRCSYDVLDWKIVGSVLEKIFEDSVIDITICIFTLWKNVETKETGRHDPEE
ncbi:hypothetical protein J6590_021521, partial [Homalodisca vitripennis]